MKLQQFQTKKAFLQQVESFLETDEVLNSLPLSIARIPDTDGKTPFMASVTEENEMVCSAIMTPPYPLFLSNAVEYKGCRQCCNRCRRSAGRYICRDIPDAFALIAQELYQKQIPVSGILAKSELAAVFATLWKLITQQTFHIKKNMSIYVLEKIRSTPKSAGHLRKATETDIPLIRQWGRGFHADVDMPLYEEEFENDLQRGIQNESIYVWDDMGPVSMARHTRPTAKGITVNFVYTPPEHRGKGYATTCVSTLSRQLLDSGYRFCTLFADRANPTPNAIYQRIGYRALADFTEYAFESN